MPGELLPRFRVAVSIEAAIGIGRGHHLNVRRLASAAGPVELVRADGDQAARVSVIGSIKDDEIRSPGPGPRQAESQFVGLAARTDEEADLQGIGKIGAEPLGV